MPEPFSRGYAGVYDLVYQDKAYDDECNFIEAAIRRFESTPLTSVLDIGCGTGGHLFRLADRGFGMTGIDASIDMVNLASDKAARTGAPVRINQARLQDFRLDEKFDVEICLFNVINYLTDDRSVRSALLNVRDHLADGGLFIFDYRNALAAMSEFETKRVLDVSSDGKRLLRVSTNELDRDRRLFHTEYECFVFQGDEITDHFRVDHKLRLFLPDEIAGFLDEFDFELLHTCAFPDLDRPVDEQETFNVAVVARLRR